MWRIVRKSLTAISQDRDVTTVGESGFILGSHILVNWCANLPSINKIFSVLQDFLAHTNLWYSNRNPNVRAYLFVTQMRESHPPHQSFEVISSSLERVNSLVGRSEK